MTISVSELRNNIAGYLEKVSKGTRILIRDEKRGKTIAQLTQTSDFDKDLYEERLRKAAGIFTAENHPEWTTESQVVNWVSKNRIKDERTY